MQHLKNILPPLLLIILITTARGQEKRVFTGKVTDSLNHPLQKANVIASPAVDSGSLQTAITAENGDFKLSLEKEISYEISVSYIGYAEKKLAVSQNDSISNYHFKLQKVSNELREIVINQEYRPIEIKKDTTIYKVDAFTSGNERKMQEALEKLPGVEVDDDGTVRVKGKKVTKMLVEGRLFFGGSTKLATKNIPAAALDEIEVVEDYNPVDFLKDVTDSDDMAMNVKLKEDKKEFVFGDIEAGGGTHKSYRLHPSLFYYSPRLNLSYIGDLNNMGNSVLSYSDLIRLKGGVNRLFNDQQDFSNLKKFSNDNDDVFRHKSQFSALNYGFTANDKLYISGVGLYSNLSLWNRKNQRINYLTPQHPTTEKRQNSTNAQNKAFWLTMKLDYDQNSTSKWYYNIQFERDDNQLANQLESTTNGGSSHYSSRENENDIAIKQYLEQNKAFDDHHKTTFALKYTYENNHPRRNWVSTDFYLADFLSLTPQDLYSLYQIEHQHNNNLKGVFKYYWLLNDTQQIHFSLGNRFKQTQYELDGHQLLDDDTEEEFESSLLTNRLTYRFNDFYFKGSYRFMLGQIRNTASVYFHYYYLKTNQLSGKSNLTKFYMEPQWESKYTPDNNAEWKLDYRLTHEFPKMNLLNESFVIKSYQSIFRGNSMLSNERYHSLNLNYKQLNPTVGWMIYGYFNYFRKVKNIQSAVVFDGTDHYSRPFLSNHTNQNLSFRGHVSKDVYRFRLGLATGVGKFDYTQTIDDVNTKNHRTYEDFHFTIRTNSKKWPTIQLEYAKKFSQLNGVTKTRFQKDTYKGKAKYEFLPSWNIKASYHYTKERNVKQGLSNHYQVLNASLDFKPENIPWGFNISAQNILDNTSRHNQSISNLQTSETIYAVLPRIFLLSIRYEF